jgi:transcription-repair coupling factor (superfamily II helicase)
MSVVSIKGACRTANIEKVDAGPRGAVIHFRKGGFPDPAALVSWLNTQKTRAKLRPDQTLFIAGSWDDVEARLKGTRAAVEALARLCDDMAEAA